MSKSDDNIDFALDTAREKMAFQARSTQSLDSKTGILLGFVGVIAANLLLLLNSNPDLLGKNLFTGGLLVLLYSFWNLVKATKTKEYLDPPSFETFYTEDALSKETIDLKNQVVADIKKCYETNHTNDVSRAKSFDSGVWSLAISLVILIIGATP